MPKKSAGILFYRFQNNLPEILLVHPGGPFWAKKDLGAWSIPKGEINDNEDALHAAIREIKEELGLDISGEFIPLSPAKQKSGKIIYAWAVFQNIDETKIVSNTFDLEWPPKTGQVQTYPEVDQAVWFNAEQAKKKILTGQLALIEEFMLLF